ncbi:hypothetical protein AURDEDRAFT_112080 [Auricularia subglabra TFB-10046 SS5]|nr:hypothetical protein AURDEDRAFT_112080 [Auricularia subglabra TFB-10046 SS5]
MPTVNLKSWFTLTNPVRVRLSDSSSWNTYSTLLPYRLTDPGVPATLAVQSTHLPYPSGTRVSVVGSVYFVDGAILVIATYCVVTNIPLPSLYSYIFFPHFSFLGSVVSDGVFDAYCTGSKAFDISVDCTGRWPYRNFTIRCLFNRDAPRFRDTSGIRTGVNLFVYGVYSGRDANKNVMITVTSCSFASSGTLPGGADLIDPVNPFAGRVLRSGTILFTVPARTSTAPLPGDDNSTIVLPLVKTDNAPADVEQSPVVFNSARRVANPVADRARAADFFDDTSGSSTTSAESDVDMEVRSLAHNVLASKAVAPSGRAPTPRPSGHRASPYGRSPLSGNVQHKRSVSTTATVAA